MIPVIDTFIFRKFTSHIIVEKCPRSDVNLLNSGPTYHRLQDTCTMYPIMDIRLMADNSTW